MINKQKIMEGIHLIAYVRDKQTKLYSAIEDSSYNTKTSFKKDLEANGYDNISILDNRDMFLIDYTNYTRVSQLKNELKKLRDDMKIYDKEKYPSTYKDMLDRYNKLKEVYDKVMKIPLTEGYVLKGMQNGKSFDISYNDSEEKLQKFKDEMEKGHKDIDMYIVKEGKEFKYTDEEDIPRYDSEIGLSMQIGWVKNRIKSTKSKITQAKYDADRNKYKHDLQYYERLLQEYKQAMDDINSKESKNESANNKYKIVDTTKLPDIKYELESRSENEDYNKIYKKLLKSKTGKIRCTYNELDLISSIYSDNDNYDYEKLNIQNILYESKLKNSKNKLEEVSRNELLAKTKGETITRYKKSAQYKGFSLVDIDINNLLRNNTIVLVCRVGDYLDYIQLEDVLYWIQIVAEKSTSKQINNKVVTEALMNAIDGMDIKVDCECGDWRFRLKYQATEWGYNYGRAETRPANIRNPNGFGALCKHLTAVLSNKKWLQQVASYLMDWCSKNIEQINQFLKLTDDKQLTLPNELARQNAKKGFYTKLFKDVDNNDTGDVPNEENPQETDNQENNQNDIENTDNNDDTDNTSGDIELQDVNNTNADEDENNK